jgi:hypothetical protein
MRYLNNRPNVRAMPGSRLALNALINPGRTFNNFPSSPRTSILNHSVRSNVLGNGGCGFGPGFSGWGYRNGGYGYGNHGFGSGYGGCCEGNRNSGYVWVFVPSLGWVLVPIRLLLFLGL